MSAGICFARASTRRIPSLLRPHSFRSFASTTRLQNTLAVLEHRDGQLQARSLNVVTAASKFGKPVIAFLAGSEAQAVAAEVAKLEGIGKVLVAVNGAYDKVQRSLHSLYERV